MNTVSLSSKKIAEYREAFNIFDQDGDGSISIKDLARVLGSLGHNPAEGQLLEMFNEADVDGKTTVQFPQFLQMMKKKLTDTENLAIEAFKIFDRDGTGFITSAELNSVMAQLGEKLSECQLAGVTMEGKVGLEKFATMMKLKL